jgi:NADH dehydrogenase [ubiquinone] 1 alpha subcomplex assembly factor 7
LGIYSLAIVQQMAEILSNQSGAALIIDYGKAVKSNFTLRGIRKHEFVNVLEKPGEVDLSVDVDWNEIKMQVNEKKNRKIIFLSGLMVIVHVFGPQIQRHFLQLLGIDARLAALLRKNYSQEQCNQLIAAHERLTQDMGEIYRAMCIIDDNVAKNLDNIPAGFEMIPE